MWYRLVGIRLFSPLHSLSLRFLALIPTVIMRTVAFTVTMAMQMSAVPSSTLFSAHSRSAIIVPRAVAVAITGIRI